MKRYGFLVGAALGLALLAAAPEKAAEASQFQRISLESLTRTSEEVVRGKVVEVVSRWSDDQEAIFTYAIIEVSRGIRGGLSQGERIVVKEVGGEVGGYGMAAIGFPSFTVGDDLVMFLTRWDDDGNFRVQGYGQGFYRVQMKGAKGSLVLKPGPVQDSPAQDPVVTETPITPDSDLETVLTRIKGVK